MCCSGISTFREVVKHLRVEADGVGLWLPDTAADMNPRAAFDARG